MCVCENCGATIEVRDAMQNDWTAAARFHLDKAHYTTAATSLMLSLFQRCPIPPCAAQVQKAISTEVASSEPQSSLTNSKCLVCSNGTPTFVLQPCGNSRQIPLPIVDCLQHAMIGAWESH